MEHVRYVDRHHESTTKSSNQTNQSLEWLAWCMFGTLNGSVPPRPHKWADIPWHPKFSGDRRGNNSFIRSPSALPSDFYPGLGACGHPQPTGWTPAGPFGWWEERGAFAAAGSTRQMSLRFDEHKHLDHLSMVHYDERDRMDDLMGEHTDR